jgi:hypothetical protein
LSEDLTLAAPLIFPIPKVFAPLIFPIPKVFARKIHRTSGV